MFTTHLNNNKNLFLLASAGAGKTTEICSFSHNQSDKKILLSTYTRKNTAELLDVVFKCCGFCPPNIEVQSWFSFLLLECIRPYQKILYPDKRIENIAFTRDKSSMFVKKSNSKKYYISYETEIFSDKLSEFIVECNEKSNGLPIKRLEKRFDFLIIDEAQDLSGYDFEFIKLLLKSKIKIIMVGDNRQKTYSTNNSSKNRPFNKNIYKWFEQMEKENLGKLVYLNQSHRCIQEICNFADQLFPSLPKTVSYNNVKTGHDGIFLVFEEELQEYVRIYKPNILVYNKTAKKKFANFPIQNFGEVKGQTFDRVLINPTEKICDYLRTNDINTIETVLEKFYVAITRAKYSVAFLVKKDFTSPIVEKWENK